MKILQVSPSLPIDVCAQASCLSDHGYLERLYTSTATTGRGLGRTLARRWMGRREVRIERDRLESIYSSDVRQRLTRLGGGSSVVCADKRFERVDRAASRNIGPHLDAVICREDAAEHTFRRAAECGVLRLYDLPITHFDLSRRLLRAELDAFPELETAIAMDDEYGAERLARKCRELELAEHILCPSTFVRRSLLDAGYDGEKIRVIPFGCASNREPVSFAKRENVVLSVGQISVRKGSHRVLEAWARLGAHRTHTLRFIGEMRLPKQYVRKFDGLFEHVAPMPRAALAREYAAAKFCVFNSMFEGMAIVIPEALSAGTPVIASRNSGADEIVASNEEGILVEYGDDEALTDAIASLLESPRRLERMSERASTKARSRTWETYTSEFIGWLESVVPVGSTAGAA